MIIVVNRTLEIPLMFAAKKLVVCLLVFFSVSVQAERVLIPGHYDASASMVMPQRGNSMEQVLAEFGEPEQRLETVGEPPITTWDYGDFRVYFEYQTVLHSMDLTTVIMPRN